MANNSRLTKAYTQYNRKYFGNKLPPIPQIKVTWAELGDTLMGYQDSVGNEIAINRKHRKTDPVWRSTLLHELCHLSVGGKTIHGPKFEAEMLRIAKLGAFKGVW